MAVDAVNYQFAIVLFNDNTVEIIRTDWAELDANGDVTRSFFPSTKNKKFLQDILKNNPIPDINWTNEGEMWPVKKTYRYFETLEEAEKNVEYYINLSDVETDDERNREKMKKSRHQRAIKNPSNSDTDTEYEASKAVKKEKFVALTSSEGNKKFKLTFHPTIPVEKIDLDTSSASAKIEEALTAPISNPEEVNSNSLDKEEPQDSNLLQDSAGDNGMPSNNGGNQSNAKPHSNAVLNLADYAYQKVMLTKVTKIEVSVDLLGRMAKSNGSNTIVNDVTYSFMHKGEELKMFPLKSKEDFDRTDPKLVLDSELYKIVYSALKNVGIYNTPSLTVSAMMENVMTFNLGKEYCLSGKNKEKHKFSLTNLYKLISKAALDLLKCKNESNKSIDGFLSNWLSNCTLRSRRQEASVPNVMEL
ncbi:uncharacterized protein LOC122508852 isoform X2 [Leptopilina heterotoma]|uniref:uncharacterized protein LOC122507471 isoform X2 n=2 Tax=Leptopilina heterotoma TaxID=63436 RepID=UPI001CAA150A|nr:uncharacterized protein LOC122507471 isoform X2 [Leptopilina heterotoma]XP_043478377.1 uncharacterized protein LOC122508852 isoform X2 [Leptopilina heterotoma]